MITKTHKLKVTLGWSQSVTVLSSKLFGPNNCFINSLSGVLKNVIQKVQHAVIKPTVKQSFHLFEKNGALSLVRKYMSLLKTWINIDPKTPDNTPKSA